MDCNKRSLCLFTNTFPFGVGEEFLESEMSYLSKKYSHIYIYAMFVNKNSQQTKHIPENIVVIRRPRRSESIEKIYNIIFVPVAIILDYLLLWYEFTHTRMSLKKIFYACYINSIQVRAWLSIRKSIKSKLLPNIHGITLYAYWLSVTAGMTIKFKKYINTHIYIISRAHGADVYDYQVKYGYIPFQQYYINNLDHIFVCSEDGTKYLIDQYQAQKDKISCAYLGTKDFGIQEFNRKSVIHILTCAHIVKLKRLNLLIAALSLLNGEQITLVWNHIGDGPDAEDLKKLASSQLSGNISFSFLGNLSNEQVMAYYQHNQVDLFVNVSESEGLPVSIMEAISFGIPIIATNVGGVSEIVFDGKNGYLLNKKFHPQQLCDLIKKVYMSSNAEIMDLRNNSRLIWQKYFNAYINYNIFLNKISTNEN